MVTGLAFAATAIATLFAEATLVRFTQRRSAHLLAWTIALAMFALASAFLAVGTLRTAPSTKKTWSVGAPAGVVRARSRASCETVKGRHGRNSGTPTL